MSLEPLSAARKNISHDRPLHFVRSLADGKLIFAHCAGRKTRILQNNLLTALKVLGQACVRAHSAGRLAFDVGLDAMVSHPRFGVSDRCARRYIRELTEAGVLVREGRTLVLVNFAGDMQPFTQEFFDQRAAHQREGSARRSAKHRAAKVLTDGQKSTPQTTENIEKIDRVTPQSFNPSRTKTKTKAYAGGLTHAAMALPDLGRPAEPAPKAKPFAAAAFVRTRAPQKAAKIVPEELESIEAELLGAPPESKKPEPWIGEWLERMQNLPKPENEAEPPAEPEQDDPADDAEPTGRRVQQGMPPKAPKPPRPKPTGVATMPQLQKLLETHARHFDGYSVNLLALYNQNLPYDVMRQAFDITAEHLRTCPMGQRKVIHNPGGYLLQTARTLVRMGR